MASDPSNVWYYDPWGFYRFQADQHIELLAPQVYDQWCKRTGKEKLLEEVRIVEEARPYLAPGQKRAVIRHQLKSQYWALKHALELKKDDEKFLEAIFEALQNGLGFFTRSTIQERNFYLEFVLNPESHLTGPAKISLKSQRATGALGHRSSH